jgi:hypothetical protein
MFLLNSANFCNGMPRSSSLRYFSMFQNYLGLDFNNSGSWNCSCARCFLHVVLYSLNAALTTACFLPCIRFNCLYCYLASLHVLSNHGARCFAHLFGFFYNLTGTDLSTPAFIASDIRYSSTLAVLSSLLWLYYSVMLSNYTLKLC